MKMPNRLYVSSIDKIAQTETEIDGKWVLARPITYKSFIERLKLAWAVFAGDADALFWYKQ